MSWNFPFNRLEFEEFVRQCLNFLKTEVEQLRKTAPATQENVIGVPFGGPLERSVNDVPFSPDEPGSEEGSGGTSRNFVIGKTKVNITAGSSGGVEIWYWNGSNHAADPSEPNITAYCLFGDISSGVYVACNKDVDTGKWYITAAECS